MINCHNCNGLRADTDSTCASCGAPPTSPTIPVERIPSQRDIIAQSAFINAKIKIGPLPFHRLATIISAVLAIALASVGTYAGWSAVPESGLAFIDDPAATTEVGIRSVLRVTAPACDPTIQSNGLAVGTRTLIVPANEIGQAGTLLVTDKDGQQVTARLIGIDRLNDLAILRADSDAFVHFIWTTTTTLSDGDSVRVLLAANPRGPDSSPVQAQSIEAEVVDLHYGPDGLPTAIELSTPGGGDLPSGSAVLDVQGRLLAVVGSDAPIANTSDQIRPIVSAMVVSPEPPAPTC